MSVKCPICENSNATALEGAGLKQYRCTACAHAFKDLPKQEHERYTDDYFNVSHRNWFSYPDYKLFAYLREQISREKGDGRLKIADIGCGKGDFLKYLQKGDGRLELYGIDLTENKSDGITFIKGDILKDSLKMKFDVVAALAVIEHVDSLRLFIEKIKCLIEPGGIFVIMTDDDSSLIYKTARALKKVNLNAAYDQLYERHHLQCFSKRSLRALLDSSGLETVSWLSHNYPVRAVDLPKAGPLTKFAYTCAVAIIFFVSGIFNRGILQTVVCRNTPVRIVDSK